MEYGMSLPILENKIWENSSERIMKNSGKSGSRSTEMISDGGESTEKILPNHFYLFQNEFKMHMLKSEKNINEKKS